MVQPIVPCTLAGWSLAYASVLGGKVSAICGCSGAGCASGLQVSRKEMQATLALRFGGEGILKMKGIPFKASAADVRKFFSARCVGWQLRTWLRTAMFS